MIKYIALYEDEQQGELSSSLQLEHINYLKDLHVKGVVTLCGPLRNSGGKALLVFNVDSIEEAESHVLKDPFIAEKWYQKYHVYEWFEVSDSDIFKSN